MKISKQPHPKTPTVILLMRQDNITGVISDSPVEVKVVKYGTYDIAIETKNLDVTVDPSETEATVIFVNIMTRVNKKSD